MKIYVKFKKPRTVKEFLEKFFSHNYPYGGGLKTYAPYTYKDKACTQLQCSAGRSRSPQDVYDCVKTYFPTVKLSTVIRTLVKIRPAGRYFYTGYCSTIRRSIICFGDQMFSFHFPRNSAGQYSWGRLLREAGFKSTTDMYE